MEANRDASRQALAVALTAEKEGNAEKAERFANKSHALFPSPEAKTLLERLTAGAASAAAQNARQQPAPSDATAPPSEASRGSSSNSSSNSAAAAAAAVSESTGPGSDAVNRVMRAQHHYEVFGVAMSADTVTIRKAYRKLAMLLHPDKNSVQRKQQL